MTRFPLSGPRAGYSNPGCFKQLVASSTNVRVQSMRVRDQWLAGKTVNPDCSSLRALRALLSALGALSGVRQGLIPSHPSQLDSELSTTRVPGLSWVATWPARDAGFWAHPLLVYMCPLTSRCLPTT